MLKFIHLFFHLLRRQLLRREERRKNVTVENRKQGEKGKVAIFSQQLVHILVQYELFAVTKSYAITLLFTDWGLLLLRERKTSRLECVFPQFIRNVMWTTVYTHGVLRLLKLCFLNYSIVCHCYHSLTDCLFNHINWQ